MYKLPARKTPEETFAEPTVEVVEPVSESINYKHEFVGYLGSTGYSTGPHAHIQSKGTYITPETLNHYFAFGGRSVSWADITDDEEAHAKRGSKGIDVALAIGTRITALSPTYVSPMQWDERSGYWKWIEFENGKEFVITHMLADEEVLFTPPKPKPKLDLPLEPSIENNKYMGLSFNL